MHTARNFQSRFCDIDLDVSCLEKKEENLRIPLFFTIPQNARAFVVEAFTSHPLVLRVNQNQDSVYFLCCLSPQIPRGLQWILVNDLLYGRGVQCGGKLRSAIMSKETELRKAFDEIRAAEPDIDTPAPTVGEAGVLLAVRYPYCFLLSLY